MENKSPLEQDLVDRLKKYIKTLKGQLSASQTELKEWVKKYGKIDNLTKNGGDRK